MRKWKGWVGFDNGGEFSELEVFQRGSSLESSSRETRRGIGNEPIAEAEGSSIWMWLLMEMEELRARRWLCLMSLEAMFEAWWPTQTNNTEWALGRNGNGSGQVPAGRVHFAIPSFGEENSSRNDHGLGLNFYKGLSFIQH